MLDKTGIFATLYSTVASPVPGAALLGVLGLAAAGRKLRKHA